MPYRQNGAAFSLTQAALREPGLTKTCLTGKGCCGRILIECDRPLWLWPMATLCSSVPSLPLCSFPYRRYFDKRKIRRQVFPIGMTNSFQPGQPSLCARFPSPYTRTSLSFDAKGNADESLCLLGLITVCAGLFRNTLRWRTSSARRIQTCRDRQGVEKVQAQVDLRQGSNVGIGRRWLQALDARMVEVGG